MGESPGSTPAREGASWDLLAEELQTLRTSVGNPSYADIARLVSERRVLQGCDPDAARLARSTVYDCFRIGRSRTNLPLVREIAMALGADSDQVDGWITRCHTGAGLPAAPAEPLAATPEVEAVRWHGVVLLLIGCVALNLLGRTFEEVSHLPVHLDMVGTAVAAIALGPWRGAVVGGATNLIGIAISGVVSLPFALVNVVGALIWGYGVRRYGMGRTLPRFLWLNVLVAVACSAVAVPILLWLYGGSTGHAQDVLSETYRTTWSAVGAIGLSNLVVSLGDKLLSGFVALTVLAALPQSLRRGNPLAFMAPPASAVEESTSSR